jgi:hypothetical protein
VAYGDYYPAQWGSNSAYGYSTTGTYAQPITFYYDQTGYQPQKLYVPVQAEVIPETPTEWLRRRVAEITDLAGIAV